MQAVHTGARYIILHMTLIQKNQKVCQEHWTRIGARIILPSCDLFLANITA